MNETVFLDTGPLVSFLVASAEHHHWTLEQWKRLPPPLQTCEAVLAEAAHLLRRENRSAEPMLELIEVGVIDVGFRVQGEVASLKQLIRRYRDLPMSLADACLVRMAELRERCVVMTTDSDFRIYRRHSRQMIPVLMPPSLD